MPSWREHFTLLARYNAWATERLLRDHVRPLPDADYRRDAGLFFRSIHGTHHRGQISAALTAMGRPCPELDLVRMLQADSNGSP
jgi:uncharacterized damage-inducible protein DinB